MEALRAHSNFNEYSVFLSQTLTLNRHDDLLLL